MAYTQFDPANPTSSQTGTAFATSAKANMLALRDGILVGRIPGWTLSVSGGTAEEPAIRLWSNGTERLRASITYTGGYVTQIVWAYSSNSGGSYDTIATETTTYDGNGNQTAGANSSMLSWMWEWAGKLKALRTAYLAHVAGTGAAVHGLGTMSTQAAGAVAITGGSVSCTIEREAIQAKGSIAASTSVDWSAGGLVTATVTNAAAVFTHTNLPNGVVGYMTFDITNGGIATSLFSGVNLIGGPAVSLRASGRNLVTLMCRDGSDVVVVGVR